MWPIWTSHNLKILKINLWVKIPEKKFDVKNAGIEGEEPVEGDQRQLDVVLLHQRVHRWQVGRDQTSQNHLQLIYFDISTCYWTFNSLLLETIEC